MKQKFLLLAVLVSVLLVNPFKGKAQAANVQDSLALVDLYNSTGGPGWINNSGWLTNAPLASWYGVSVFNNRVTKIIFFSNNLDGVLPSSIGNLSELQRLWLAGNQLKGSIPASIGNLSKLNSLLMDQEKFTGSIPTSLGNLTNLTDLSISLDSSLSGPIPASLGNLINLTSLDLEVGRLSGDIPASLGNLTKLTELKLRNNQLTGDIPTSLGNLVNLEILYLGVNKLTGSIPVSLGNLVKLSQLYLDNNSLTGTISPSLGNIGSLSILSLGNNQLTGSIPDIFNNVAQLTYLYLNNNHLSGIIPTSLAQLSKLQSLLLNDNQLTGSLPVFVSTFQHNNAQLTTWLLLQNNFFTFDGMENLPKADSLKYSPQAIIPIIKNGNSLSVSVGGSLSDNTYKWYKDSLLVQTITGDSTFVPKINGNYSVTVNNAVAKELTLYSTAQNIIIPANIRDSLVLIDLYNITNGAGWANNTNWLTANPINSWYGIEQDTSKRVTSINFRTNNLTGTIPLSIGSLDSLKYLILRENQLHGQIPDSLGNLTKLQILDLSGNSQINGNIPSSLGNLSNLTKLNLGLNNLTDSIPSSLARLTALTYLALESNQLSGKIPGTIGALKNLDSLYLGGNQISGAIPSTVGNLNNLIFLNLASCYLTDSIPSSLGNLSNLTYLNLGNNLLSGTIPSSFGNLKNLKFLLLPENQLSGTIPSSIGNLSALTNLGLSNNRLTGPVPSVLAALPNISIFDISYNSLNFSGLEGLFYHFPTTLYSHQALIPVILAQDKLYVSAGGKLLNNTYVWYKNGIVDTTIRGDSSFSTIINGIYNVTVTNSAVPYLTLYSDTLTLNTDSTILPARPANEYASYEYTDTAGWTHYYYNNNTPNDFTDDTLLLSLKKNGQDIGTIGDGTFAVKLVATAAAGSNAAVKLTNPLITNSSGYWVMNRYWQVTPTHEPASSVGVRFYYNNQDLADVNGSYPAHNLTNNKLIFYKAVGGNPDPTSNLAGATNIISIMPGTEATDTTWTYHALSDTTQYGEYSVASFSGGGGGGTGNNQALPVVLVNFTGNLAKNDVQLNWQTAQEVNAGYYTVERSLTGRDYMAVGRINAAGNSTITQAYKHTDYNAALLGSATLYYRLKITDKNGYTTYSNVLAVNIAGGVSGMLVYPNPAKNTATVIFYANATGKYAVEISNVGGKTISRTEGLSGVGINKVIVDLHGYPQGAYMITLKGTNIKQQNITLLKQ